MSNIIIAQKSPPVKPKYKSVTVELPPALDGSRRRKRFYGKTLKEARRKADDWKAQNAVCDALGIPKQRAKATLSQIAEQFLSIKAQQIRPYSFATTYRQPYDKYLAPAFGDLPITTIDTELLDEYFLDLAELSERSQQKLKMILHAVFELAVEYGYIERNPVDKVHIAGRGSAQRRTLTDEQYERLYSLAEDEKLTDIILLLDTGIRRSELLSLRWRDIDLINRCIVVDSAVTPDGEGDTKTVKSNRLVPLTDRATAYLSEVRAEPSRCVVGGKDRPMTPSGYAKHFKLCMEHIAPICDIPPLTPHELRHTFGTLAHAQGVDVLTISRAMGHSTVNTTAKYYVHDDLEAIRNGLKR